VTYVSFWAHVKIASRIIALQTKNLILALKTN